MHPSPCQLRGHAKKQVAGCLSLSSSFTVYVSPVQLVLGCWSSLRSSQWILEPGSGAPSSQPSHSNLVGPSLKTLGLERRCLGNCWSTADWAPCVWQCFFDDTVETNGDRRLLLTGLKACRASFSPGSQQSSSAGGSGRGVYWAAERRGREGIESADPALGFSGLHLLRGSSCFLR